VGKAGQHPKDYLLRQDRLPHIWCPTCGIGTAVACFIEAIEEAGIPQEDYAVVSGIGCTGRVAGYVNLDSFHTTHGRAIPFATGLACTKPHMKVIVFSGDGDITGIGGNHLIHAARRNIDLKVFCINNFIYGMTGGQVAATTPTTAKTTTSPYGCFEHPFNLPHLVTAAGATYVARWTALHIRRLRKTFKEAILKKGFSFVEIIAPCSTLYARKNRLGTGYDLMKFYHDNSEIKHGADTRDLDLPFQSKITVGKFVDIERPTWMEMYKDGINKVFGAKK
jgi:2-oxoglutarate ferredoxin oxidoreductase subunit beta